MHTKEDVRHGLTDLPDTLLNAYDKIYNRILAQKRSAPRLALKAFWWIKGSCTPLQSETVLDAISFEVGETFSREHTIKANDLLQACQNLIVLDHNLNVFRFAHLSVDEYLETRLSKIDAHTEITKVCLSLLASPSLWDGYDRTMVTTDSRHSYLHLLLYSTVFWPWHFSLCEGTSDLRMLHNLWDAFVLGIGYQEWRKYIRRTVVQNSHNFECSYLYWRRVIAFQQQTVDDPLSSLSIFGLSRACTAVFESRTHVEKACLDQLLLLACEFKDQEIVRMLIGQGADVSAANMERKTPLHLVLGLWDD